MGYAWRKAAAYVPPAPVDYSHQWRRVSRAKPCPVCGKAEWCTVAMDGMIAICMRVAEGSTKSIDLDHGTGYIHRIGDSYTPPPSYVLTPPAIQESSFQLDYDAIFARWSLDTTEAAIVALAQSLCVSRQALKRLSPAWCAERQAWAFPMHDDRRQVVGVRFRSDAGKFSLPGSHAGLFMPSGIDGRSPIVICEGPTDTAAAVTLGCEAIGRPSCSGGTEYLCDLLQAGRRRDVIILADNDGPGRTGGRRLADRLLGLCRSVRLITAAPHKDVRAWLRAGCTPAILQARIGNAEYHLPRGFVRALDSHH